MNSRLHREVTELVATEGELSLESNCLLPSHSKVLIGHSLLPSRGPSALIANDIKGNPPLRQSLQKTLPIQEQRKQHII